jgi:hypothetical protein
MGAAGLACWCATGVAVGAAVVIDNRVQGMVTDLHSVDLVLL